MSNPVEPMEMDPPAYTPSAYDNLDRRAFSSDEEFNTWLALNSKFVQFNKEQERLEKLELKKLERLEKERQAREIKERQERRERMMAKLGSYGWIFLASIGVAIILGLVSIGTIITELQSEVRDGMSILFMFGLIVYFGATCGIINFSIGKFENGTLEHSIIVNIVLYAFSLIHLILATFVLKTVYPLYCVICMVYTMLSYIYTSILIGCINNSQKIYGRYYGVTIAFYMLLIAYSLCMLHVGTYIYNELGYIHTTYMFIGISGISVASINIIGYIVHGACICYVYAKV